MVSFLNWLTKLMVRQSGQDGKNLPSDIVILCGLKTSSITFISTQNMSFS